MTDTPDIQHPLAVYTDNPVNRHLTVMVDGDSGLGRDAGLTFDLDIPDNCRWYEDEDDVRALAVLTYRLVFGQLATVHDIDIEWDGPDLDEEGAEAADKEFIRRVRAIHEEYQRRAKTASSVISEAIRRRLHRGDSGQEG